MLFSHVSFYENSYNCHDLHRDELFRTIFPSGRRLSSIVSESLPAASLRVTVEPSAVTWFFSSQAAVKWNDTFVCGRCRWKGKSLPAPSALVPVKITTRKGKGWRGNRLSTLPCLIDGFRRAIDSHPTSLNTETDDRRSVFVIKAS